VKSLDVDSSGKKSRSRSMRKLFITLCWVSLLLLFAGIVQSTSSGENPEDSMPPNAATGSNISAQHDVASPGEQPSTSTTSVEYQDQQSVIDMAWHDIFGPGRITLLIILILISGFFSASEVAFFSLHRLHLRSMRESDNALDNLAARLMEHPGNLLTTILMSNSITNVSLSVFLAQPMQQLFDEVIGFSTTVSFIAAVMVNTGLLLYFGEILPKILVVRQARAFANAAAIPVLITDYAIRPLRLGMIAFIGFLFRVTRYSELPPAPFMTDDEFKSVLTESEASGVIETDERKMIQGIIDVSDEKVRSILVPRPDMVVLPETATVAEALELIRDKQLARIPVYEEDLDHIIGLLYAKDLLHKLAAKAYEDPIRPLMRKVHFVPETTSIADFVRFCQQLHTHLVIVVDEYGGTEGLVTLQDALREVVGDVIGDEEETQNNCHDLGHGVYELEGGFSIDALNELAGISLVDDEHTTIAGFLMDQTEKLLEEGDSINHEGIIFEILEVDNRRVNKIRVKVPSQAADDDGEVSS